MDSRVRHDVVTAPVERDGSFELVGLEPGFEYELSLLPTPIERLAVALRDVARGGLVIKAPSRDVTLESSHTLVHIVVEAGGESVRGVELAPVYGADYLRGERPEALRQDSTRANNQGELVALVDSRGERTPYPAPGRHRRTHLARPLPATRFVSGAGRGRGLRARRSRGRRAPRRGASCHAVPRPAPPLNLPSECPTIAHARLLVPTSCPTYSWGLVRRTVRARFSRRRAPTP